ncbi:MAG: hypothetical protein WCH07_01225 [Deltaproteobacteria bacterium]
MRIILHIQLIRKPRKPNWTMLAVGEGETERAFLQFLKSLYNKRDDGISIKVNYAGGGDPECVIDHAVKSLISLDKKKQPPYTPVHRKQHLIKTLSKNVDFSQDD